MNRTQQAEPFDLLLDAIRKRDRDRVQQLLRDDPSLAARHDADAFGATPLIHAVLTGDRTIVDALLDGGADIDQRSDWWAGSFGVLDHGGDAMADYLLERGATLTPHAAARLGRIDALRAMLDRDPEAVRQRGGDGQMPLHFARTQAIADLLLERGAEIDARDLDHESTPAQWLAYTYPEVAAHLIERGCATDPFLLAATGQRDRLETALAADPEGYRMRLSRTRFPVKEPAAGHIYIYTIGEGSSLLHPAARNGHAELVRWLIEKGCDPNQGGGYDDATALHHAAWNDHPEAIEALLDGGADIDKPSGEIHRNEAIGWAILPAAEHAIRTLLAHGARVRDEHREDAQAGARGEFRQFNRDAEIERWQAVATLFAE